MLAARELHGRVASCKGLAYQFLKTSSTMDRKLTGAILFRDPKFSFGLLPTYPPLPSLLAGPGPPGACKHLSS